MGLLSDVIIEFPSVKADEFSPVCWRSHVKFLRVGKLRITTIIVLR